MGAASFLNAVVGELHQRVLAANQASAYDAMVEAAAKLDHYAGASGNGAMQVQARFWRGAGLHGLGRLDEAAQALAAAADPALAATNPITSYWAASRLVLALVEQPAPRAAIARQLAAARRHPLQVGPRARSRLLLARGRLALARGEWLRGRRLLQASIAALCMDGPAYSRSSHFRFLCHALAQLEDHAALAGAVASWTSPWNQDDALADALAATVRADLARCDGALAEATLLAQHAQSRLGACEDHRYRRMVSVALLRSLTAQGRWREAAEVVVELEPLRATDCSLERYALDVVLGDHALSVARAAAQLPPRKVQCGVWIGGPGARAAPGGELKRAGLAYARAQAAGEAIDRVLGGTSHADAVASRQALLAHTRQECRGKRL